MILSSLRQLFQRDLDKLKAEIEQYNNEADLWLVDKDITNCAGNLCLHLVGNLNAFIGAELGQTGYIRQRKLEFSLKNVAKQDLVLKIEEAKTLVDTTLANLDVEDLEKNYPINVFKEKMTTGFFLMHLSTHLTYHLGQINYHRRLLGNN